MRNLTFITLILIPVLVSGQSWFNDGDVWVSTLYGYPFEGRGFEALSVSGDTIISNTRYKIIEHKEARHVLGGDTLFQYKSDQYVREENDSIFHLFDGVEYLIYDFNMEVGDSIQWFSDAYSKECAPYFRLDSIYSKEINGFEVTVQEGYVGSSGEFFPSYLRIYEGIGAVEKKSLGSQAEWYVGGFLFPNRGLSCYQDAALPSIRCFSGKQLSIDGGGASCFDISSVTEDWFHQLHEKTYVFGGQFEPATYGRILSAYEQGDTSINGLDYKKVANTVVTLKGEDELVYEEDQALLVRHDNRKFYYWTGDSSHLVYDFTMSPGDSLQWYPQRLEGEAIENCTAFFVLDSLSIERVEFLDYHVQHGRIIDNYFGDELRIEIYESIGWVKTYNGDSWHYAGFLIPELNLSCYFDSVGQGDFCQSRSISGVQFPLEERSCLDLVSTLKAVESDEKLRVIPNPASSEVMISKIGLGQVRYQILNLNGQQLRRGVIQDGRIDIRGIPSGVYLLNVKGESIEAQTLKFIKL